MNRKILNLAVPNIISNITIPLLSSVDTAVMGHLESPVYLGAIALGSMIFNFIYWGFGFLRMGTTGLAAQSYGAGNNVEISSIFYRSIFVSIVIGFLLIILQYPIAEISFFLIDGSQEVEQFALEYYNIRIFAAPATLGLFSIHGWLLGMQNARHPLYISLFINLLNIALNFLFVYQFNMKVDGVAWATLIAQYSGIIFAFLLINKKYRDFLKDMIVSKILDSAKLKNFIRINSDILIRTLLLIFTLSFFTAKSAEIDDTTLAANFVLLQLWLIVAYGVDGFAFAAESLMGKYYGAKDRKNMKKTIKYSFTWGISLGLILGIFYFLFGREILNIYTSQIEVIDAAMIFIPWIIISPVINSVSFIWDGIYFGLTATREMLYCMIISTILFFLPSYYLTKDILDNHSIWFSLTVFMFVRGLTLTINFVRRTNRNLKIY